MKPRRNYKFGTSGSVYAISWRLSCFAEKLTEVKSGGVRVGNIGITCQNAGGAGLEERRLQ